MKWLRSEGCTWNKSTSYSAVENGNLEEAFFQSKKASSCLDNKIYLYLLSFL